MNLLARIQGDLSFESNVRKSYLYRFLMEFQLWLPIWILYLQQDRGFSLTQITILDTPFFLLMVLAEVPTGAVADRFGRRVSLMLGSGFFAVAIFVFGIADNYAVILISYVAWGLALTFQSGADVALLYDSLKAAGREHEFQRVTGRLWALRGFATVLALLIGAPLAAATSFTFVITLSAIIGACAFPVAFLMHEPRHAIVEHEPYLSTIVNGLQDVWKTAWLRYIILYSAIVHTAVFGPLMLQQLTLAEFGISVGFQGVWQTPVRAAGIAASLMVGWLLTRVSERAAFFSLPVVIALCSLALAGIDQSWVLVAFIGLGFIGGIQNPLFANYINHRIPSQRRATLLSIQNVVFSLIIAWFNPLGGIVADRWGLQTTYALYGVTAFVFGTLVVVLWHRAERAGIARGEIDMDSAATRTEILPA
jgi:MFS family permease